MSLLKAADISAAFFEKSSHEKPGATGVQAVWQMVKQMIHLFHVLNHFVDNYHCLSFK